MVASVVQLVSADANNRAFPDAIREGILLLVSLAQRGIVQELVDRVRVQRAGFMGVDGLAYLMLYASMTVRKGGLRAVWGAGSSHAAKVGGILGRESLASSSAMSRLLAAATLEEVYGFSRWLLVQASGVLEVMREPVSNTLDGQGRPRRLFAFDPVRIAVRWRGCPEGEDLPPVRRRSEELVAPGHAGRKRGEAVASIGVVEDLGSGAVLDVTLSRGNGDRREMFGRAADAVVETMGWLNQPLAEAVLVSDGEFGWVPYFTECAERNLPFLSRCSRYELLDRRDVRARLQEGPWVRVDDSGSGPTRWAVEVGTIELEPGRDTLRDDGSPYDRVKVRLVVSRYEAPAANRGCGHQIGSHRFELFASIGVEPSSLSASDVVTTFYARCGQENSFLQQKSLGVHRVVSNTEAGQLFAAVAAMFVWNLRLVAGVQLAPTLPQGTAPAPRAVVTSESPILPPLPEPPAPAAQDAVPLATALELVHWKHTLSNRVGWTWNSDLAVLVDPIGTELPLSGVERHRNHRKLRFISRDRSRQATVAVPEDVGIAIATALRGQPPPDRTVPLPLPIVRPEFDPPPFAIRWPELLCAAARNSFKAAASRTVVTVRIPASQPALAGSHPLVEPDRHRRRHRRLTWTERTARYAAKRPAVIRVATPDERVVRWLQGIQPESTGTTPGS